MNATTWLPSSFAVMARFYQWSESEQLTQFIASLDDDIAAEVLSIVDSDAPTFQEIREAFIARYGIQASPAMLFTRFSERTQFNNEAVVDYLYEKNRLYKQSGVHLDEPALVSAILQGLNSTSLELLVEKYGASVTIANIHEFAENEKAKDAMLEAFRPRSSSSKSNQNVNRESQHWNDNDSLAQSPSSPLAPPITADVNTGAFQRKPSASRPEHTLSANTPKKKRNQQPLN